MGLSDVYEVYEVYIPELAPLGSYDLHVFFAGNEKTFENVCSVVTNYASEYGTDRDVYDTPEDTVAVN